MAWNWKVVTFLTCCFGFFRDLRPSEPFLSVYLTGPSKNFTIPEVNNEIYPWWTYSYLFYLIPVFMLTDYFRYKPMLVIDSVAYISTFALLLWAKSLPLMKLMEMGYGLATAGEIGYYSYLYAVVPKDRFKKVSSFTRAASNAARFAGCLIGQLVVSFNIIDLYYVNIITFADVCLSLVIACVLPRASHSELFNSVKKDKSDSTNDEVTSKDANVVNAPKSETNIPGSSAKSIVFVYARKAKKALKNIYVGKTAILWSFWWVFGSLSTFQLGNYIQNLWKLIADENHDDHAYNGAVEAATALFCSLCVLVVGFVRFDFSRGIRSEVLMTFICLLNSAVLLLLSQTSTLWLSYLMYGLSRAMYQVVLTIATAQIANSLTKARYGFVFGCNMFMALVIETIVTVVVIDDAGLGVDVRTQFSVYGYYYVVMTIVFFVLTMVSLVRNRMCTGSRDLSKSHVQNVFTITIDVEKELQKERQNK